MGAVPVGTEIKQFIDEQLAALICTPHRPESSML
jgi:hypothetical protein